MKRDMDLIREILLAIEARDTGFGQNGFGIEGRDYDEVGYHVHLLDEAGLVVGIDTTDMSSTWPTADPARLTWKGYEFLESIRPNSTWAKVATACRSVGSFNLDVIKQAAIRIAAQQVNAELPVDGVL